MKLFELSGRRDGTTGKPSRLSWTLNNFLRCGYIDEKVFVSFYAFGVLWLVFQCDGMLIKVEGD